MRIRSHAPLMWLGMAVASLPTLAPPSILLYLLWKDGEDRWFAYVFMAPFLIVGLLLGYFGLRALLRIVVRGSWQLEIPNEGGLLGQPLSATLFPTRERRPDAAMTCRLRCIRIVRTTRGSARSSIPTLWETTWTVPAAMTIQPRTGLALVLPLPDDGMPSQMDRTGSGVQWQLNVVVPFADGSDEAVFDVPVKR